MSGFSKNIICLIKDMTLAKKMGQNGLNRVNKLFTADRMAREYQTLLQKNI